MLGKKIIRIASLTIALLGSVSGETMERTKIFADGFKFSVTEKDEAIVTGYDGNEKNLFLPSRIFDPENRKSYCITRIAPDSFMYAPIESIMIPRTVQMLELGCFNICTSLKYIFFETDSELMRIELRIFHIISLRSITIPCRIEILG
ncbi:MAG: leucine-rich repeat domain-containing protein, partial [Holosporales bacterium]|nr:leucine-rich repeat domain-containing protein [Holosporales bacterium]